MKTVMAQGTFDILHPGHLHYFEESKKLGDELVVVISRDSRHEDRKIFLDENDRQKMVQALETVDKAVLGTEGDIYETVEKIDPDVITLGYDQNHSKDEVKKMAEEATGHKVTVKRIEGLEDFSSSKIKDFHS
ncbi:adenylyltransferase/cytidyltransferase family protein [Candidatus Nanosalina sp. VS9-1]|uniref:adenylyltransferase/cytidyltransferase family protein n=1 Tax=Candidatus Nanosalina sp. VS9-1 TaxID=3388566 RepID=UPI0039E06E1D